MAMVHPSVLHCPDTGCWCPRLYPCLIDCARMREARVVRVQTQAALSAELAERAAMWGMPDYALDNLPTKVAKNDQEYRT